MVAVLIGELNPYGGDPYNALIDYPAGCSGDRMRRLVCGLSEARYRALPRYNLCRGKWSIVDARAEAARIARFHPEDVLVLLGRKVAEAFRLGMLAPFGVGTFGPEFRAKNPDTPARVVTLPHPSGLCRVWVDPDEVAAAIDLGHWSPFHRARALLAEACPDVPWGEIEATP